MISAKFHPEAQIEMIKAAEYYEHQQFDLGKRFLLTVQEKVKHIRLNPFIYSSFVRWFRNSNMANHSCY